jgi:hypothetical protein
MPDWSQLYEQAAPRQCCFRLAEARAAGYSSPLLEYYVASVASRVSRVESFDWRTIRRATTRISWLVRPAWRLQSRDGTRPP